MAGLSLGYKSLSRPQHVKIYSTVNKLRRYTGPKPAFSGREHMSSSGSDSAMVPFGPVTCSLSPLAGLAGIVSDTSDSEQWYDTYRCAIV